MRMYNHQGYFFNNDSGTNFSFGKVLNGIIKWNSIFIQSTFNTAVNNINDFFMQFCINFSNADTFLKAKDFLTVEETDKKFEHVRPHNIRNSHHKFPDFMREVGPEITLYSFNKILQGDLGFNFVADFPNVNLQPLTNGIDFSKSSKKTHSQSPSFYAVD